MIKHKVFAIGFQKTGTTSLGRALEILGYRVGGYLPFRDMATQENLTMEALEARAFSLVEKFDAVKDTPWPIFYRQLDERYPGSRFILVTRNTDNWIRSATKDFAAYPNMIHRLIYGCDFPMGNEQIWIERYERHNAEVTDYFRDRPEQFVSLNLDAGEVGFKPICEFLGCPVHEGPWPHLNQIQSKKRKMFAARALGKLGFGRKSP